MYKEGNMNNNYEIIKNIEKIKNGFSTRFLDNKMQLELKKRLKKNEYNIYYPYLDSEKVIFYQNNKPNIILFEIITKDKLEHREILGSIFSLGLNSTMFGDIVITNNHYYIYVLNEIKDYFINNLIMINKSKVKLESRDLSILEKYERKYEKKEIIASSERIDTIISHLIKLNRNKIKDLMKNKDILLNYEVVNNISKKLVNGDVFSIRRYGKYKYMGIIKYTKNNNLIIQIDKYI